MLVKTNDRIIMRSHKYEIVIADNRYFVACPINNGRVIFDKAEIYSNDETINTLKELDIVVK